MQRTVIAVVLLVTVESQHHDALTGRSQRIPDLFVKGHRDKFSLKPQTQHHDSLTGSNTAIPDLFIKGHKDNFVIKPQTIHHDALTGLGRLDPDLILVKGHRSNPVPAFSGDLMKRRTMIDIAAATMSEDYPFCKVSGGQCSQFTLKKQWMWLATSFAGFLEGTCWQHGYKLNSGSEETSMPLIGKTMVRFFSKSESQGYLDLTARAYSDNTRTFVVAAFGLVGIIGVVFTLIPFGRGSSMAGQELLLPN